MAAKKKLTSLRKKSVTAKKAAAVKGGRKKLRGQSLTASMKARKPVY